MTKLLYKQAHALLDTIINVLPDAFVYRDISGKLLLINDAMRNMRPQAKMPQFADGVIEDDLVNPMSGETIQPGQSPMGRALRGEVTISEELHLINAEGIPTNILVTSLPVFDEHGEQNGAFSLMRDITQLKSVSLKHANDERARALNILTTGIAHEFNNQMSVVLANAQLGLIQLHEQEKVKGKLDNIVSAVGRGSSLIERLMALGNAANDDEELLSASAAIRRFMPSIQAVFESTTELVVDEIDSELFVRCNQMQFESVILNLLLNARRATRITECPRVSLTVRRLDKNNDEHRALSGDYMSITVEDNGSGFTQRSREDAFIPFFTTYPGSKGLGLTIVDEFARQLDGWMCIDDQKRGVTGVELILPCVTSSTPLLPKDDSRIKQ